MQKERDFPAEDNSLGKNRDGNSQGWKDGALNTRVTCRLETDNFTVIGNCNNQNSVKWSLESGCHRHCHTLMHFVSHEYTQNPGF